MDLKEVAASARQRHPWELARYSFFSSVLRRVASPSGGDYLDVGSGDAWFASSLRNDLGLTDRVTCWDVGYDDPEAVARTQDQVGHQIELTAERPRHRYRLITLLDVLEHVEDADGFLRQVVSENVAEGGFVLVSVPTWQLLFSSHDVHLGHHRRYSPAGALALLAGAGLEVVDKGGLFHSLLLPRALTVLRERLLESGRPKEFKGAGAWSADRLTTSVVQAALRLDNGFSQVFAKLRLEVPGLTWWALCRKPAR